MYSDYSEPPVTLAGIPAIIHDKEYGKIGAAGAKGLFIDIRTSHADMRFEIYQKAILGMALSEGDYGTAFKAWLLGNGLGTISCFKYIIGSLTPSGREKIRQGGEASRLTPNDY